MKTAITELIDFAIAHQLLCEMNAKKAEAWTIRLQLKSSSKAFGIVIKEAKRLKIAEQKKILNNL